MNIRFRPAELSSEFEKNSVLDLLNQFMHEDDAANNIEISIFEKLAELNTTRIFVCENDKDIIAIAVCFVGFSTLRQMKSLNIHDFFVDSKYQGKGIGRQFLEYIENTAKENNYCRLTLEVYDDNKNALKLYRSFGFKGSQIEERDNVIYAMKKEVILN